MNQSLLSMKFPATNVLVDFAIPLINNDTLLWKGQIALVVDADGDVWQTDALVFDTPWYYCAACSERQSVSAKFCPKCGVKLDWEHMERDPEAEADFQKDANAKVAAARKGAA